jgi:hypothetical protein
MLTADCIGRDLLHPVEECKEVSQGKSTNISRSMFTHCYVEAALMGEQICTMFSL